MGADACRALLAQQARSADLVIVEGVMGLFDGPQGAPGSTADLAAALGLPVLLVIDCAHQAQSVAALVQGFTQFRKDVSIAGVFLNRVKSDRHERELSRRPWGSFPRARHTAPVELSATCRRGTLDWCKRKKISSLKR